MILLMKKIKVNFMKQEINHTLKIIYENMNNLIILYNIILILYLQII